MEENQFLRDLYGQLEGDPEKFREFQETMMTNPKFRKDLYNQLQGDRDKFAEFERQFVPSDMMPDLQLDLPGMIDLPDSPRTAPVIDPFNIFGKEERVLSEEEIYRNRAQEMLSTEGLSFLSSTGRSERSEIIKGSKAAIYGTNSEVINEDLTGAQLGEVFNKNGGWYANVSINKERESRSLDLLPKVGGERESRLGMLPSIKESKEYEIFLGPTAEFANEYNLMPPEEKSRRYQEDPEFAEQVWRASSSKMNEELGITTKKEFDAVISNDTSDYYTTRSVFDKAYKKAASKISDVSDALSENYPVEFKEINDLQDRIEEEEVRLNTLRNKGQLERSDIQQLNILYESYEKALSAPVGEEGIPISETPLMQERIEIMERVNRLSEWYEKSFQQSEQANIEERASKMADKVQGELEARRTRLGYQSRLIRGKAEGFVNRFLGNIALAYGQGMISLFYGGDDSKAPQSLIDARNAGEEYMRIGESAQGTSNIGPPTRHEVQLDDGNIAVIDEATGQIMAVERKDGRNVEDSYDPYQFLLVEKEVAKKFEAGESGTSFSFRRFVSESADVGLDMLPMFVGSAGITRAMGALHSGVTGGKVMSKVVANNIARAGSAGSIYSTMVGGHFLGALDQGLSPQEAWELGTTNAAIESLVAVSIGNVESRLTRKLAWRERGMLKNALRDIYTGGKVGYKQLSSAFAELGNLPRDIVMNVIEENTIIALQSLTNAEAGIENAGITMTDIFNTSAIAASMGAMMSTASAISSTGRRALTLRDRFSGKDTFASRIAQGVLEADPSLDVLIDEIASANGVNETKAADIKEGLNRIREEYNSLPESMNEADRAEWAQNAVLHLDAEVNETDDSARSQALREYRNAMDALVKPKITGEEAIQVQIGELLETTLDSIPEGMGENLEAYANMEDGSYIKVDGQWFRYETAELMYKPVTEQSHISDLDSNSVESTAEDAEAFKEQKRRSEEANRRELDGETYIRRDGEWRREREPIKARLKKTSELSKRLEERFEEEGLTEVEEDGRTYVRNEEGIWETETTPTEKVTDQEILDRLDRQTEETLAEEVVSDITDQEYDQFTDTGQVSEDILSRIANKIANNETLSKREQAIFTDKTSEIEAILRGIREAETTTEAPEIFNHVRGGIEIPYQIVRNENGEVTDILREDGTPLKKGTNYWNRIRDNANEARPEETTEVNELTLEDGRQVRQEDGQWYYINEDGSTGRVVQERHTRVRAQINNKLREQERASTEATETAQETSAAEPIQETTAPESVETTTEPTPEATTETSAEPATETTTEQTISEGETSWYLDNNGRVVLVRRDGSNWVTTEGDVGATVPEQFAEQADQNIDREATPDEISKTLPENVVADPTEDGKNVGTYAKYNPETDTWHESDPQGTEGEEITAPRRVNRLNEALERKQSAEETAPTETPQETPVEQTTQEETSTPEPTETDVTEASEPQTITHRGREYTRTVEEGNAIWRNKDGKQMSERYSTQLEKALETQAQTEAPAAETTETTPSETSGPQTATIDFRGKERTYTKEDGVWRNEAGREIKGERLINRLERQLEERAEQKPTEDVVVEEPLKKDLKDETKFSKEEQRVIEEGDGILEESTADLGRTTETDGNDAKQEAVSQSEVEATAKALEGVQKENADKFVNDFVNIDIPFRQENIQAEMDSEVKKQLFPNEKTRRKYAETIYSAVVRSNNFPKILSESYHKAKADGSNPELVEAVEDLIGKPTAQEAEIDAIESKKVPAKVRGQKTVDGKTYNPIKSDNVTGRDWVDAETGEPVNKNSHVYEHLEGMRDLNKQKKVEEDLKNKEAEVKAKETKLKEEETKKAEAASRPTDSLTENMRFSRAEAAAKMGVDPESIVPLSADYTPKSGDVLIDNNTGQVVRLKEVAMGRIWFVDNLTTGVKNETRGSLHLIGEWSIIEGGVPKLSAPTTVRVPYSVKKKARTSVVKSILNYFSNTLGLSNNIIANASQMAYRLNELGFISIDTAKEFYEGDTGDLPLEKPKFFGNEIHNVVGFYDPMTNRIYLDPNRISPTDTMEEFTHMFQHAVNIASMRGDKSARAILNSAKRVFKSEVDAILKGQKGKLGLDLESNLYNQLEGETAEQHRERIFEEVWAKASAPEVLRRFKEESSGKKDFLSDLKRRVVGLLNKAKNFFLESIGVDRSKLSDNPTIEEVINLTAEGVLKGDFLGNLSTLQSPTIESSLEMSTLRKADFNEDGTVSDAALSDISSENNRIANEGKDSGTWLKAPNGEKSELNQEQWVYVRTQRFKEQFGDWENTEQNLESGNQEQRLQKKLNYARQIIEGNTTLKRLDEAEEQGRIKGGERNVEASVIAGTGKATVRGDKDGHAERRRQERELKNYAQREGIWVENYNERYGEFYDMGGEARVYYDGNIITKVNDLSFHESPIEFLDRITLHNLLFPESPYTLIGFTHRTDTDSFSAIVQQPFIQRGRKATKEEIRKHMKNRGFEDIGGNAFKNDNYIVEDLHAGNVYVSPEGNLMFIDPIIYINTPAEDLSGNRQIGDGYTPANEVSQVLDKNGEPKVLYGRINTDQGVIMETVFIKSDQNMDSIPNDGLSPSDVIVGYDPTLNYTTAAHLRFSVEKGRDEIGDLNNERVDIDNLARNRRAAARQFGRLVRDKIMPESELQKIYDAAKKNRDNVIKVLSQVEGLKGEEGKDALQDTMNIFDSVAQEWARRMDSTPELFYSSVLSNVNFVSEIPLTDGKAMGRVTISNIGQFVLDISRDANVTTPVHELAHIFDYYMTDKEKSDVAQFYLGKGREWDGSEELREAFANGFLEYIRNMANVEEGTQAMALAEVFNNMKDFFVEILTGTKIALTEKDQFTNFNAPTRALYESMSTLTLPVATQQEIKTRRTEAKKMEEQHQRMEYRLQNSWFDRIVNEIKNEYSSQINNIFIDVKRLPQDMNTFYMKVAQHDFVRDPTTAFAFAENMMYQLSQGVELGEGNNPNPSSVAKAALGKATEALVNVADTLQASLERNYKEEGLSNAIAAAKKRSMEGRTLTKDKDLLKAYDKLVEAKEAAAVLARASSILGSEAGFDLGIRSHLPENIAVARLMRNTGVDFSKLSPEEAKELIELEKQKYNNNNRIQKELEGSRTNEDRIRLHRESAFRKIKEIKSLQKIIDEFRNKPVSESEAELRKIIDRINSHPGLGLYQRRKPNLNEVSERLLESTEDSLYSDLRWATGIIMAQNSQINSFTELYNNLLQYIPNLSQNQLYSALSMADPSRQRAASNKARTTLSVIKEELRNFKELMNHLNRTTELFSKPGEYSPQEIPQWITTMQEYMDHIKYLSTLDETTPEQAAILAARLDNIADIYTTLAERIVETSGLIPTMDIALDIESEVPGVNLNPRTLQEMTDRDVATIIEEVKSLREEIRERNLENREKKLTELIGKLDKGTYEGDFGFQYFTDYDSVVDEMMFAGEIIRILKVDPEMSKSIENYQNESNINSLIQALYTAIQNGGKFDTFENVVARVKEILHNQGHTKITEPYILKTIFRRTKPAKLIRDAEAQIKSIREEGKLINELVKSLEDAFDKYDPEKRSRKPAEVERVEKSEEYQKLSDLMDKIREVSKLRADAQWHRTYYKELEAALYVAQSEFRDFLVGGQQRVNLDQVVSNIRKVREEGLLKNLKNKDLSELEAKVNKMYEKYKNEESSEGLFSAEDDFKSLMTLPGFALKHITNDLMEQKKQQELLKKKERELFKNRALKVLSKRILEEEKILKRRRRGKESIGRPGEDSLYALRYYRDKIEGERQKQYEDDSLTQLIKENRVIDSKLREKYQEITGSKKTNIIRQIANTPRLLTLAADYSFVFYQGGMTIPIIIQKAFAGSEGRAMAKNLFWDLLIKGTYYEAANRLNTWGKKDWLKSDKDWFERSQADLVRRTYYAEGVNSGLQLTDPLNMKVEDRLHMDSFVEKLLNYSKFSSSYLDKIGAKGLNRVVSAPVRGFASAVGGTAKAIRVFSERMYISYMNELRLQLFEQGMEQVNNLGFDRVQRAAMAETWAEHINILTGTKRLLSKNENWNKSYNTFMQGATMILTAPRLYASAFHSSLRTMYDPFTYIGRRLRKEKHIKTGKNSSIEDINKIIDSERVQKRALKLNMTTEEYVLQEYGRQMAINHYMTNLFGIVGMWGAVTSLQALITGLGMGGYGDDKWDVAWEHALSTTANPMNTHFMRLNIGGRIITTNPIAAYFRTWLKLLPLAATNFIKENELDDYFGPRSYLDMNIEEIAFDIFKYKVSPISGPINTLLLNRDFKGDPISDNYLTRLGVATTQFAVPIAIQDVIENIREEMALGSNLADGLRGGVPGGLTEGALDLIGLNSYQLDPYSDSRVQAHAENEGFRIRYYMGESTGNKKLRSSYKGLMIKKYMRTYFGEQVLNSIKEGRPMTKKQMESTYKTIAREAFIFADEPIPKQLRSSDRIRSF